MKTQQGKTIEQLRAEFLARDFLEDLKNITPEKTPYWSTFYQVYFMLWLFGFFVNHSTFTAGYWYGGFCMIAYLYTLDLLSFSQHKKEELAQAINSTKQA